MERLGAPSDQYLQNKENIPPIFNYLAPSASKAPNPSRPISPPPRSLRNPTFQSNISSDHGVQTEPVYQNDEEVQTDLISVTDGLGEAYYNLAARYDVLRDELNTYKGAHEELQEKYLKNKKIWEAWTKTDAERREQSKKRKRDGGVIPEAGGQALYGYTTPATSTTSKSPRSRPPPPPTLSPNKPISKPLVPYTIPKKLGLFAGFKRLAKNRKESHDLGIDIATTSIKNTNAEGSVALGEILDSESEGSDNSSWPSSVPETQEFPEVLARENLRSTVAPNATGGIDETTDSESSESRGNIVVPKAKSSSRSGLAGKESLAPPPLPSSDFKVPKITKEKLHSKLARSGESVTHPVVIKTESSGLSSEGFGYHLFEEDSLDLDDIGCKPDTPRKRQKTFGPPTEGPRSSGSNARVGWTNGGFTVKRTPDAPETQSPDEITIKQTRDGGKGIVSNNEKSSVPVSPPLSMNCGEFGGIRTNSQPMRPKTPPEVTTYKHKLNTTCVRQDTGEVSGNKNPQPIETRISPPPQRNSPTLVFHQPPSSASVRRGLSVIVGSVSHNRSLQKPRVRRRITSADAIANITEDGTDGTEDVGSDVDIFPHPPMMLTEKQRKKLEGTTRLSDTLNFPVPKTPSLAHLKKKKMDVSKSAPAKGSFSKSFDSISSSEPPKRNAWIDPMRSTRRTCEKQGPRDLSKLDISHFRVNPDVNEGRDYAFAETVRNREARRCLPGCAKTCCKELAGFVEAAGLPSPAPRGPRWRSSSPPASVNETRARELPPDKKFTAKFGKHRDAFARRRSPPGFWNADFPDTQAIEKQNEAAEEMRMQKVEDMKREAEKGGKGRYIYKDW